MMPTTILWKRAVVDPRAMFERRKVVAVTDSSRAESEKMRTSKRKYTDVQAWLACVSVNNICISFK